MKRRTPKLTARELEVLDLVRLGLTNDEIAERLSITSDGVKYHVSQVLTKLGVSSRHEAVGVAYSETRRPWWSAALALTLAKAVGVATVLGVTAFLALLLWGVFRSGEPGDFPDVTGLAPETAVASVQQAVTRPGQVLHSRIEATTTHEGEAIPYFTTELWVDAARETVRYEYRLAPESYHYDAATESTAIIAGKYSYVQDSPGKAHRYEADSGASGETVCAGVSSLWMAVLLTCSSATAPGPAGEPHVVSGDFHGRGAIVISYRMSATEPVIDPNAPPPTPPPLVTGTPVPDTTTAPPGATQTVAYTWRIYLDPGDYLPIGYTFDQSSGDVPLVAIEAAYENEFVPIDQEIETLLDPSSIGYGAQNADALLDEIANRLPVYWLGEEFSGANGLGELVLTAVNVGEQRGGVQQVYPVGGELVYQAPDGYPELHLFLWRKDGWEAFLTGREGRILTDTACARTEEGDLDGGHSTVYLLPALDFPAPGRTPTVVVPGETSGAPGQTFAPAPGESECNYERRYTALVDRLIGVVQFGDVVVQVRQDGEAESVTQMRLLMQQLRAR